MQVIGFFKGLFYNFSALINFINTPLSSLDASLSALPPAIGNLSIFSMLSIGIGTTLLVLLVIHVVRLIVG